MPRARAPRACAGRAGGAHPGDKEEGNTVKRAARAIVLGVLGIIWVLFVVVVTLAFTGGIHVGVYKPVLYVYPEREQSLTVSLDVEGELGTVYPAPDALETTDWGTRLVDGDGFAGRNADGSGWADVSVVVLGWGDDAGGSAPGVHCCA